ncbi:MAG: glycosyltransferase family 39 protein [Anaerolineales bacterium]
MPSVIRYSGSVNEDRSKRSGLLSFLYCCALLLCGLLATYLLSLAMKSGMGISSDSIAYIGVSEHIVAGKGLNWIGGDGTLQPMTHFPPLYPLLLAGIQTAGLSSIEAARWINDLAFGANVFMIGWFIFRISGNFFAPIVGSLLAACSPIMISWHSMAMSEPIFITFLLVGMGLLSKYFERKRVILLIGAGVLFGLHYLTRYAGLSIIVASTLAIFLSRAFNTKQKIRSILMFLLVCITPMMVWMVRNMYLAGNFTNRRILWHPPSVSKVKHAFAIFWEWIVPYKFTYTVLYGIIFSLLITAIFLVIYYRKLGKEKCIKKVDRALKNSLLIILILYALCYSLLILATMTFFDASTPMDTRITLPLYIVFLILMPSALTILFRGRSKPLKYILLCTLSGLLLVSYIHRSVELIDVISVYPRGYGSESKQQFADIDELRELPADTVIYTNNIEGLYFQFNLYGHRTPIGFDSVTMLNKPQYKQELTQMRELLETEKAVLVLFFTHIRITPSEWTDGLKLWWEYQGTALYAAKDFYDRNP